MEDLQLLEREYYKPTGRVNWLLFLPMSGCLMALGYFFAILLFLALVIGLYFIIVIPAVVGLCLAGPTIGVVYLSRCRNRVVGAMIGLLVGVICYLGYFHVGMLVHYGPEYILQPQVLPEYIVERMNTDVQESTTGNTPSENNTGDLVINWFAFCVEFLLVAGFPAAAGYLWASRPFDEESKRWMKQKIKTFRPGSGEEIRQLIASGQLGKLSTMPEVTVGPGAGGQKYTAVTITCLPADGEKQDMDSPVYLSVKEVKYGGGLFDYQKGEGAIGKNVLPRMQLKPEEIASLSLTFPDLKSFVDEEIVEPVASPATDAAKEEEEAREEMEKILVEPAPEGQRMKVMNLPTKILANVWGLLILVAIFGGIGIALLGVTLWEEVDQPLLGIPLVLIGIGILFYGIIHGLMDASYFSNFYLQRKCIREFLKRPELLVDPRAPDAWFIEIVPREHWGQPMLEDASDVGFLRVGAEDREVHIEGDLDRYWIPVDALLDCEVERFSQMTGSIIISMEREFLILRSIQEGRPWELPVRPRFGSSVLLKSRGRKKIRQMQEEIIALINK